MDQIHLQVLYVQVIDNCVRSTLYLWSSMFNCACNHVDHVIKFELILAEHLNG